MDFGSMSNLPADLRKHLIEKYRTPFTSELLKTSQDEDGTVKITLKMHDGGVVESVLLIDEHGRKTACLSSQIGCALGCTFCRTGTMGLIRDLTAGEIVEQYLQLRSLHGDIHNIVFMGMGEPMMNLPEVLRSIEILHHPKGLNIGMRRITISTSGVVKGIDQLAQTGLQLRLAVSLITADQDLRAELMPVARTTDLDQLQSALIRFQGEQKRRITLEYVVFHNRNTRDEDVNALARFTKPLQTLINIIPWNPVEGLDFQEPGEHEIHRFQKELEKRGITTSRRYRRGRGINGACGQLAAQDIVQDLLQDRPDPPDTGG